MIDNNFFEKQTVSSRVKASIVSEYFPKYAKIIIKKHIPEKIRYIDLFAGPGKYEDGNPSTPILVARNCKSDDILKNKVWMVFNDVEYSEQLRNNFYQEFNQDDFHFKPHFGHSAVGENEDIDRFITRSTIINRMNEAPSVLFIDPFGYKNIETNVLAQFMNYWGNELFIFINSKRINAALENEKFETIMECLFPTTFRNLQSQIRYKSTLMERLQFIINNLGEEYRSLLKSNIYYTAFKFQEEDINTTSHYILHITKSHRGYDLIKQIYNDFANIGTVFDGKNTYTFDPKHAENSIQDLFDNEVTNANIEKLASQLAQRFGGKEIDALSVFDATQKDNLYSRAHYTQALRKLVDDHKVSATFNDKKNHMVSVLLIKDCILKFE
ncbi:MAG TPA: three-Cys-motif partner protein TcmP [Paludibacteraceae bacterium]|nr:three-Cys-motif partner protein TcmP [Paludibacteraceae bacterium]